MGRFQGDLPERTFRFALEILRLARLYPHDTVGWVVGRQLVKSGTSIGANVHEADQAMTEPEFASTCNIARRESAETNYWLRLSIEGGLLDAREGAFAVQESDELTSILSTVVRKTRQHVRNQ